MAKRPFKKILPLLKGENGEQRLIRFWSKVEMGPVDQCWNWKAGHDGKGYGRFKLVAYHSFRANRIALVASTMKEPEGMLACHTCDNPTCCNPAHLYFGTALDNMRDMNERGRWRGADQTGANNGNARIDEAQLALIVQRLKDGWSNKQIAADIAISHAMVSKIRLGHHWAEQTAALGWEPKSRLKRHA